MNRKGLFETIALAVVTMMLVGVFSVLGTKFLVDLNKIIRRETVGLAGARVSTTMYATDSIEKANVQINFPYKYEIFYEDTYDSHPGNELMISFSYNDKTESAEIKSARWLNNLVVDNSVEDQGKKANYCLKKREDELTLETGKCN